MQESNERVVSWKRKLDVRARKMLLVLAALWVGPAVAAEPIPDSMAALGDSITQAATTCSNQFNCPENAWATGTNSFINSHYQRILAKNPQIQGRNYNFSVNGDWSAGLLDQAISAVAQDVDYVALLIGANDACAASEATMTPVADFAQNVGQALDLISSELPDARIFVSTCAASAGPPHRGKKHVPEGTRDGPGREEPLPGGKTVKIPAHSVYDRF